MYISVIIPTYNPNIERLLSAINGLRTQTISPDRWELIIVDNNSTKDFSGRIDLSWHQNSKIVQEKHQGLTYARVKGFSEAKGEIVVLVDDDNILDKNYLHEVLEAFNDKPDLGAIGGKSIPLFETSPPPWLSEFLPSLALRDLGERVIIDKWENKYPDASPIGAGMATRKQSLESYIEKVSKNNSTITDRKGNSLGSSGDNDIILEVLKSGWRVGYFPSLVMHHIIPKERMQVEYVARLINNTNKSWIQLLESHGINLWARIPYWTVPLRKIKSWFVYRAWQNKVNYIRWRGACGAYDGLSDINYPVKYHL
ncbi:glycosyltransferase family 2 protein [Flavihumibacter sp. R14]|nr:glycosyltransferase family 2 protein [Flavihumibacter soli]